MKLKLAQKYEGNKRYVFPSDNLTQEEKNEKRYFRDCANAIVWKYVNNKTFLPYSNTSPDSVLVLRSYMNGTNSPEKYKNILVGPKDQHGKRKTTMNISWRVPNQLAQKMDVVKGFVMKLDYENTAEAMDVQSRYSKDMTVANMKLMADDRISNFGTELNGIIGEDVIPSESENIPFANERQVEMFNNIGGIVLEQEISAKTLMDDTSMLSDDEGIDEKVVEDLLSAGICGTKAFTEKGCNSVKKRWVDIDKAIIPYSDYNDFRDITWAGEFRQVTGLEMMREYGMTREELIEVGEKYGSDQKSPDYRQDFYYQVQRGYTNDGLGMNMLESMVFDVADVCWIGNHTDTFSNVKRKKEGHTVLNKVSDDYTVSERAQKEGKTVEKYTRQCVYKASLIVGTDYVFNYGKEYNQTYSKDDKGKFKTEIPYSFMRTGSTSLTSRGIGFQDNIALAEFKKRQALKKMPPPPGVYIEQSAFENINIGGVKMDPLSVMKLFQDEGYLIGNSQDVWGKNTVGRRPIEEIPSGIVNLIMVYNSEIEFNTKMIEAVTGINEIFAGATPQKETGLGVSQIAINATQNAIFPVIKAYERIKSHTNRIVVKKWQVEAQHHKANKTMQTPRDRALSYLKVGKGMDMHDFLIKISVGATEDEKLMLLNDIKALQDVRRQAGVGGIRPSDYLMLFKLIKAGQIDQARLLLAQVEEYVQKLDEEKQAKLVQDNMESQMMSNQQAAENEVQSEQQKQAMQGEREAQNIMLKARADMLIKEMEHRQKLKETAIANVYGWSSDNYNRTVKVR